MYDHITKDLSAKEPSKFHETILQDCKALVHMSRNKMKEYYATWDKNDEVFRALKASADKEDIAARERKEPEKLVVPVSYAQIQTFISFCYNLYTQRDSFFELEGFTPEDDRAAKVGEALLARDLKHNIWEQVLNQYLLDVARFGVGVVKCCWSEERQMITEQVATPQQISGVQVALPPVEREVEKVVYQGNKLINVSPYRFFPDTRLPLSRFQEGSFCASEEVYSHEQLKKWEREGLVSGVEHIDKMSKESVAERGQRFDEGIDPGVNTPGAGVKGDGQVKKTYLITEVVREIVPKEYMVDDKPLGEEDHPVKYVIWYANDNRVIKCEPFGYLHDQYPYGIAQYITDNNQFISGGLSDIIDALQSVVTWFINARITNVRKIISDKLIVNTSAVVMEDIQNRRPIIRLKNTATGDIDRHIKQLQLQDVTASHVGDAKFLNEFIKEVTGINDTILGQIKPGKRSATENRNTTSGAATRLKTIAALIFRTGLEPIGRQMLSNLRDGLDEETYVKALGQRAIATPEFIRVTKSDLAGNYDFEIFDGTMPTDRQYAADVLKELILQLLSAPQIAQLIGFDIRKLFMEMLTLRGIKNPERFLVAPQPQPRQEGQTTDGQQQSAQSTTTTNGQPAAAGPETGFGLPAPNGPGGLPAGIPGAVGQPLLPFPTGGLGL
jgi:hypothetical protein